MVDRTVLLGKGDLAIRVGQWFLASPAHELVSVVPVVPEPVWTDSLASWARSNDVAVLESGDYRDLGTVVATGSVDLAFSVFYDKILSTEFLSSCGRALNLHNAPLPRYRGVAPINWALKNREHHHGVTIHDITPGIDDGPIVGQTTYSIYPDIDEVEDVYGRALAFGYTLFEQTMPLLGQIVAEPQDNEGASYYTAADQEQLEERRSFTRAESRASKPDAADG